MVDKNNELKKKSKVSWFEHYKNKLLLSEFNFTKLAEFVNDEIEFLNKDKNVIKDYKEYRFKMLASAIYERMISSNNNDHLLSRQYQKLYFNALHRDLIY